MADCGGFRRESSGFGVRPRGDEDFDEQDVWGVAKDGFGSGPDKRVSKNSSGSSSAWRLSTTPKKIPRANTQTSHEDEVARGSSAPVDIPDWSKIYGKKAKKGSRDSVSSEGVYGYGDDHYHHDDDGGDEDGDDEDDMIPPHEWIARKLARSQISSFSVCEGMGRTLKGRDLSKVRNAILTKTGFIE